MQIGDNVRRFRKKKGITQEELAEQINVGRTMVVRIETGTKVPPLLIAAKIADVLGCTVDDLLRG